MQIDGKLLRRKDTDGRKENQASKENGKVIKVGRKENLLSSCDVTFLVNSLRALSSQCGERRFKF